MCYNAIKSLQLYILFLVALGLTESCVLYKAENRAEENPLPGRFLVASCKQVGFRTRAKRTRKTHAERTPNARELNHAEKLEHRHDDTRAVKSEHVHEVEKNCCYHMSCLLKARHCNPARYIAEQGFFDAFVCLYLAYLVLCRCKLSGRDRFSAR